MQPTIEVGGTLRVDESQLTFVDEHVARYIDVVRPFPDALELAMRSVSEQDELRVVGRDTVAMLALALGARPGTRLLELGTGVGYLTVQLAQQLAPDAVLMSVESDPILHGRAHEFLRHANPPCAVELRLGDAATIAREMHRVGALDAVILTDPTLDRAALCDELISALSPGGLIAVPFALDGGRVALLDPQAPARDDRASRQRALNRLVSSDARLSQVLLAPIDDGLLLARRRCDR